MAYLELAASLARAKERANARASADAYMTELLELSAGTDAQNITHYRPFYVAAKWLEQNRQDQTFTEADGAKFTGQAKPIESLLGLQFAYDTANGLTIPPGFEAGSSSGSGSTSNRRIPRSYSATFRP